MSENVLGVEDAAQAYINGGINHELKAAISGLFIAQAGKFIASSTMSDTVNERQLIAPADGVLVMPESATTPAWEIRPVDIKQYAERSLGPVGVIIEGTAPGKTGRPSRAWAANSPHIDLQEALHGLAGSWGLDQPDVSIQQLYGATGSTTDVRSPAVRHRIFQALLAAEDGLSRKELDELIRLDIHSDMFSPTKAHLTRMEDLGIIERFSKFTNHNPAIYVRSSTYMGTKKFEKVIPETKALYEVLKNIGDGAEIPLNTLLDMAKAIDPTIDTTSLRTRIKHETYPNLIVNDATPITKGQSTHINLDPMVREPLRELVSGIDTIVQGNHTDEYQRASRAILASNQKFRALVQKASDFSPHRAGHSVGREELDRQVLTIVKELGSGTIKEVRDELIGSYDRRVARAQVGRVLLGLARSGLLQQDEILKETHSTDVLLLYSPVTS